MTNLILFMNQPKISYFIRNNFIYCRVRLNNTVSEFSTKEKINRRSWNQDKQMVISKDKIQEHYLNTLLTSLKYKLKTCAISERSEISAKELIKLCFNQDKKKLLVDLIDDFIKNCTSKASTIMNHEIRANNLREFEAYTGLSFSPDNFTLDRCKEFINWYQQTKETTNLTSANRNLLFYKQVLVYHRNNGKKLNSDLFIFVGKKDKTKDPIFLTVEELDRIKNKLLCSEFLTRIKDLFLFQCYTGLSYVDLYGGNWEIEYKDYGNILTGTRGKNGQAFFVPLENELPMTILEKYSFQLPKYENAVYNRTLKELAAICGIDKRITTHTGRKTFATLMDGNGWTRETISLMLGHSKTQTTETYYIGKGSTRLINELKKRRYG